MNVADWPRFAISWTLCKTAGFFFNETEAIKFGLEGIPAAQFEMMNVSVGPRLDEDPRTQIRLWLKVGEIRKIAAQWQDKHDDYQVCWAFKRPKP